MGKRFQHTYQVFILHAVVNTDVWLVADLFGVSHETRWKNEVWLNVLLIVGVDNHITDWNVYSLLGCNLHNSEQTVFII